MVFPPGRKDGQETTGIIPDTWILDEHRCLWPPYRKQKKIDEDVVSRAQPSDNWAVYEMRILRSTGKVLVSFHARLALSLCLCLSIIF